MSWTPERVKHLRELVTQDLSASDIAVMLGGGLSRNAIIGKVRRLGLALYGGGERLAVTKIAAGRKGAQTRWEGHARKSRRRTHSLTHERQMRAERLRSELGVVDGVADLQPENCPNAVSFMDLSAKTCRWPIGDPAKFAELRFCGDLPEQDKPYCTRHCLLAYRPPERQI
jgi:GcrA cell cycle regulator